MKVLFAVSAILSFTAGAAVGGDLCHDMRTFEAGDRDISLALPKSGNAVKCTQSLMLGGGAQAHCGWAFPYRSPKATDAFEDLISAMEVCLGPRARVTTDLDVNHPDFYDLQTFQLDGQEFAVSLKDKAALLETYVFLRIALPE